MTLGPVFLVALVATSAFALALVAWQVWTDRARRERVRAAFAAARAQDERLRAEAVARMEQRDRDVALHNQIVHAHLAQREADARLRARLEDRVIVRGSGVPASTAGNRKQRRAAKAEARATSLKVNGATRSREGRS